MSRLIEQIKQKDACAFTHGGNLYQTNILRLCQPKRTMHRIHRPNRILTVHQHRDPDLRSRNHIDIHVLIIQTLKHLCSHTRIRHHAALQSKFRNFTVIIHSLKTKHFLILFEQFNRLFQIIMCNRKGNILRSLTSDRLDDNIHINILLCQCIK